MFNSLSALPPSLYNIINYLATDKSVEAENLWKMLKYNDYDALNKPNLTTSEKLDMLWRSGPQEKYSIFLTNLIEDALPQSKCVFKLYDYMVQPEGAYVSSVIYAFDFLYGGQMSLVEYDGIPVARGDVFINSILSVLNGVTIGGVGKLMLDDDLSRYCGAKSVVGNQKTFTGYVLYLATNMGDTGIGEGCDD